MRAFFHALSTTSFKTPTSLFNFKMSAIPFNRPLGGWAPWPAAGPLASLGEVGRIARLARGPAAGQGAHPPRLRELTLVVVWTLLTALTLDAATVGGTVRLVDSQEAKVRRKGDFSGVVIWLESAGPQPLEAKPRRVQ